MALHLHAVAHGPPAADALRRALARAKAGDPLRPATVVVPSNTVGVAVRRRLASGAEGEVVPGRPGLAATTFLTTYRLAELLGAGRLAAEGRRPVSTPVLAAAFRRALADEPGVFAAVAHHPATEEALIDAHRELRDLSPEALRRLAGAGRRADDIVRLHGVVTRALAASWYDEADLFGAARRSLDEGSAVAAELGSVILHLPSALSRAGGALVDALATRTEVAVVAAFTGHEAADADVVRSLLRCGLDEPVVTQRSSAVLPTPIEATRLVSASDADEEARAAVRTVVEAARSGTRLDRIAVLHPTDQPYARLLADHLHDAGIAHNGPSVRPLRERAAGRALLGLLELDRGGYRRDALFDLLTDAPVRDGGGRRLPTAQWEELSRHAGVVSGLDQWRDRLTELAVELRDAGHERDADRAEWLRDHVLSLARELRHGSWRDRCERLSALLHRLLGEPATRGDWPLDERRAAERVDAVLARLATLDAVAPEPTPDAVARTIELELDADLGRDGRLGDGVAVGPLSTATGLDLDLVVIVGLAEGTLPGRAAEDALIPDHERAATEGELRLRAGRLGAQHRQLLAALAAAGGGGAQRVLVAPRGDLRRSADRVVSRWAIDSGLDAEVIPSHAASLTRMGTPATTQEWRVRALAAADATVDHPLVVDDRVLRRGVELRAARDSRAFTRFDGNLAGAMARLGLPRPSDPGSVVSPTGLEAWVSCPFHYFVDKVLRVRPVENPEERVVIDPLDYGTLVHAVLEEHVVAGIAEEPDPEIAAARLVEVARRRCGEIERHGLVGHPLYWERRKQRLLADLVEYVRRDRAALDTRRARAVHAELRFGRQGEIPAVEVALSDGRCVRMGGSVDRIDRDGDGSLRVIDYKSGKSDYYRRTIGADDPLAGGTKLQLPVYGLAARAAAGDPRTPVHACYSFPTSAGGFGEVGYLVDDAVLDAFSATVERIVDGIEAGVFVPHPDGSTRAWVPCTSCDPDGLGVVQLRRSWLEKAGDPALADYVAMVEPDLLDTDVLERAIDAAGADDG